MNHRSVFVSTAIPYVNAAPHLGFALEVVLADVIARHARARRRDVVLVSGTDDHSLKNVRAAEALGQSPSAFVERAAGEYRALERLVGASYDDFVRTSVDPRHREAVHALWDACARRGDLEKRSYRGLYCAGCEQFYEDTDRCAEHDAPLEIVEEENWFFRLSRYQKRISEALTNGAIRIHPLERANEILRIVESGLHDVSVSRSQARARGWGIPVPGDPSQAIYVWFDALVSYVTANGFRESERRVHVLGKGILRFHAVLWPALLLAAGLPLPTDLVVHGYVTIDGRKIGKSLGNGIAPSAFVEELGCDGLRWFLLRHVGAARDADVSVARATSVYESELADGLGNLVARTLTLARTSAPTSSGGERSAGIDASGDALVVRAAALEDEIDAALDRFAADDALRAIFAVVVAANGHLAHTAPWKDDDPRSRAAKVSAALVAIERVGRALAPFLPETSQKIARALVDVTQTPPILFPKKRR